MSLLAEILLIVNIFVSVALIAVVLIQRSEGGALGVGGGGANNFLTTRGAGDLLTRITWILAGIFFVLALAQTLLIGRAHGHGSIVDRINIQSLDLSAPSSQAPVTAPAAPGAPPALQAPIPTVQTAPAAPGLAAPPPANPLSALAAPTLAPAPTGPSSTKKP